MDKRTSFFTTAFQRANGPDGPKLLTGRAGPINFGPLTSLIWNNVLLQYQRGIFQKLGTNLVLLKVGLLNSREFIPLEIFPSWE